MNFSIKVREMELNHALSYLSNLHFLFRLYTFVANSLRGKFLTIRQLSHFSRGCTGLSINSVRSVNFKAVFVTSTAHMRTQARFANLGQIINISNKYKSLSFRLKKYLNKTTFFAFIRVVSDMSPTMVDNRIMAFINKFAKMASI